MYDVKKKYPRSGPDIHGERKEIEYLKNKGLFEQGMFKDLCEAAGIPPTIRQASKFRKGKGKAFAQYLGLEISGVTEGL